MKPSEVIIDNLKGDGYEVYQVGRYEWIVYRWDIGRVLCKSMKELSDVWAKHYPNVASVEVKA